MPLYLHFDKKAKFSFLNCLTFRYLIHINCFGIEKKKKKKKKKILIFSI